MARSDLRRGAMIAATLVVAGLAVVVLFAPEGDGSGTASPAAARSASGAPAAAAEEATPAVSVRTTARVTLDGTELAGSLETLAAAGTGSDLRTFLRARRADAARARTELEAALDARRLEPVEVARALAGGLEPAALAFVVAQALAPRLDTDATAVLLAALATEGPGQAQVVLALRGSPAPAVDRALINAYDGDAPGDVRAAAAFALADRAARLDPHDRARLRDRAVGDLRSQDPARLEAAADVLGALPQDRALRDRLEDTLVHDLDPRRRAAALRALATNGVAPDELTPALVAITRDPSAPDELRRAAAELALAPARR